ncbi:Uncharacterised protein [Escherichia coli]|uniref:Uncharacterized protein n=1 Tax=Escherichia coli TaxID=562 RepID=A0A377CBU0_ECOLX|nr:Uncharacterised protein [Escherichia coli]
MKKIALAGLAGMLLVSGIGQCNEHQRPGG